MKPGIPWSVKGIEPEAREAAKLAARRAGLTLGEWLNSVIFDQSAHIVAAQADSHAWENFVPPPPPPPPQAPEPPRSDPNPRPTLSRAAAGGDESATRLQDIARQLADLAKRERHAAPLPEPDRSPAAERVEFERIVQRLEDNERQTVEALTAVNERLALLGRQIAQPARAPAFERPEDVPGYNALETAIRNVVEHIEVSEKRTRDSLRAMQDRLADMAERRGAAPGPEDILRAAPVLSGLEARLSDMLARIQRSEGVAAERIEAVKAASQQMANQAQSGAVTAVRGELREVETRLLASMREAQAAAATQPSTVATEIARLHGDMVGLAKRFEDLKAGSASERDLHALRGALEQLSARVAQGADMRPLADMDRRLGDINRRLEQSAGGTTRESPRVGVLEQRIAELDHRLGEVLRLQGDQRAVSRLEESIAAVDARVAQTERQLGNIETMEQAIRQLYDSIEQSRASVGEAAEAAAARVLESYQPPAAAPGFSPELRALEDGLRAVRESAAGIERRNQDTFEAVHETLADIVRKIARLEEGDRPETPRGEMRSEPYFSEPPRQAAPPEPEPEFVPPIAAETTAESFAEQAPEAASEPAAHSAQESLSSGDDFIAAARRAAQAASTRPSALRAEFVPPQQPDAPKPAKPSLLQRFRRTAPAAAAATATPAKGQAMRKTLILAGIILLAAASVYVARSIGVPKIGFLQSSMTVSPAGSPTPAAIAPKAAPVAPLAQSNVAQSNVAQSNVEMSDPVVTGSLPSGALSKTRAVPIDIQLQPPPPEAGTASLRNAAANGDARAQFIVAGRYLDGKGVGQDFDKAFFWYQQSAARGLAPAQYRLATLYELGKGVTADPAQALAWCERAAAGGNVRAMHNAAVIAAGDKAGAPDFAKAFGLFTGAAERGFRDSQFNLAILYERGLGTKASPADAYLWYSLAAKQGDPDSGQRAAALARKLPDADLKAVDARLAVWKPVPSDDSGNVVTVIEPAWQDAPQG